MSIIKLLKKYWAVITLGVIIFLVCLTNYTPHTWLTGWDNLHPEFNFAVNINRSIYAVWQEYQGLGLLGGMGHASDLPRQLFLLLVSIVLPKEFLRYFFHFLMLFVGVFGIYKILKDVFLEHASSRLREYGAFLGALFYLFNLGTAQYFYTPFEPYSIFWGFFPWEMYTLFRYLKAPSRQNLLFLAVSNILAIPQGYVQTIFLVYIICTAIILAITILKAKTRKSILLSVKILILIGCINAFWILPNLYFVAHDVSVTENSIHNKLDTEKFFQMNKRRGTITDFALLKEFTFDLFDTQRSAQQTTFLMYNWRNHLASPIISFLGYFFFGVVLLGIGKSKRYRSTLVGLFLISCLIFLSDTPIISSLNNLLRLLPLVSQIFRNPFSKFIVPTVFVFAVGFGIGASFLLEKLQEKLSIQKLITVLFAITTFSLLVFGLPVFKGQLIAPQVRVAIPQEYFDLFSFFRTQDKDARIMNLPQGSFWGWGSYQWGSTGSGFLWYGIEQPIMDRTFDVWSEQLEGYYWELLYAMQKKDTDLFNLILEKYHIGFVLFDGTYTPSDSSAVKALFAQRELLANNPKLTRVKTFGSLSVYQTQRTTKTNHFISYKKTLPNVLTTERLDHFDDAFAKLGPYYTPSEKNQADYLFPFASLFTNRIQEEQAFTLNESASELVFTKKIPKGTYMLSYPSMLKEPLLPSAMFGKRERNTLVLHFTVSTPTIVVGKKPLQSEPIEQEARIPLLSQSFSSPLLISINNQTVFQVENVSDTFTYIGSTYLTNVELANTINIYATKPLSTSLLSPIDFLPQRACNPKKRLLPVERPNSSFELVLQAKNISVCSMYKETLPILASKTDSSLTKISFEYQSEDDEYPRYCISASDRDGCANDQKPYKPLVGFSNQSTYFEDYLETSMQLPNAKFQLILEATTDEDHDLFKHIRYRNITVTTYPLLGSAHPSFTTSVSSTPTQAIISLPSDTTLEAHIPKIESIFSVSDVLGKNYYKKHVTMPTNLPIVGEAHLQEVTGNQKTIRIFAQDTYAQFWLRFPEAVANYGYLVELQTKNVSGFPLIVNIATPDTNNKYIYTIVDKHEPFTKNVFVLPPIYEFDKGLQMLLMSSSFNRIPSVNDIRNISLYPLPYAVISSIALHKVDDKNAPENSPSDQEPIVTKYNHSLYTISLGNSDGGFLTLSQTFHPGWSAYLVSDTNFLSNALPFFFGKKIPDHVLISNWANGWLVPSSSSTNSFIIILFWPQYLEYIGFFLFIVVTLACIISFFSLRKNDIPTISSDGRLSFHNRNVPPHN